MNRINVAGLLSVLLVLVVEFMLWNPVHRWNPRLPHATHAVEQPDPGQGTLVTMRIDGSVYVDRIPVVSSELPRILHNRFEPGMSFDWYANVLFLEAEPDVSFSAVQEVLELSRKAGAYGAVLLTERDVAVMDEWVSRPP